MRAKNITRMGHLVSGLGRFRIKRADSDEFGPWQEFENGVTTEGMAYCMSAAFDSGPQELAWYVGLIDNAGVTLSCNDTAVISGNLWTEVIAYQGTTRPTWDTTGDPVFIDPAPNCTVTFDNVAFPATYVMTGSATVFGAFLCSEQNRADNAAETLYATAGFSSPQALNLNDTLEVDWTIQFSDLT